MVFYRRAWIDVGTIMLLRLDSIPGKSPTLREVGSIDRMGTRQHGPLHRTETFDVRFLERSSPKSSEIPTSAEFLHEGARLGRRRTDLLAFGRIACVRRSGVVRNHRGQCCPFCLSRGLHSWDDGKPSAQWDLHLR